MKWVTAFTLVSSALALAACGGSSPDARYPSREAGCPVKRFPGEAQIPVDDLGAVEVDCPEAGSVCERRLLDAVCARGGDVAFGLGENAISSNHPLAHAAHSKRATKGPRERECSVQVFAEAPPMPTENVGAVVAVCSEDDSKDVCLRELQDQACLLGGDVVWQVEGPTATADNKQRMRGQAAHTK